MRKYIVFGAGGSIGHFVTNDLKENGHDVVACVRGHHREVARQFEDSQIKVEYLDQIYASQGGLERVGDTHQHQGRGIDGIIYSVGNCPPGGAKDALNHPISELGLTMLADEFGMHQLGPVVVYQAFCNRLNEGGAMVFISSAITRIDEFQPGIHVRYHQSTIAAQDILIQGMREDPVTIERNLKIHRIAPGAVETTFHTRSEGPHPPALVKMEEVANEIRNALESREHYDKQIVREPPK
jgi:short-subunit dehydrogenase